jgi:hypothetical protein
MQYVVYRSGLIGLYLGKGRRPAAVGWLDAVRRKTGHPGWIIFSVNLDSGLGHHAAMSVLFTFH